MFTVLYFPLSVHASGILLHPISIPLVLQSWRTIVNSSVLLLASPSTLRYEFPKSQPLASIALTHSQKNLEVIGNQPNCSRYFRGSLSPVTYKKQRQVSIVCSGFACYSGLVLLGFFFQVCFILLGCFHRRVNAIQIR